jgi:hypothetical protein
MSLSPESKILFAKIEAGLKLAVRRLYEERAAKNETVVVSKNGKVQIIPAKILLEEMNAK